MIYNNALQSKKVCGTCRFWEEYSDRVFARLSFKPAGPYGAPFHELRRCRFVLNPQLEAATKVIYTDCDFTCDTWDAAKGWKSGKESNDA